MRLKPRGAPLLHVPPAMPGWHARMCAQRIVTYASSTACRSEIGTWVPRAPHSSNVRPGGMRPTHHLQDLQSEPGGLNCR